MSEYDRDACPPCRGTGKISSTQGGDAHDVTCPWCEGSGRRAAAAPSSDD
jgi:DnaJ-class molecular chaperone